MPMVAMGRMGHAPAGLGACGEGEGQSAPGSGRAGSYGLNIPAEKIAVYVYAIRYIALQVIDKRLDSLPIKPLSLAPERSGAAQYPRH